MKKILNIYEKQYDRNNNFDYNEYLEIKDTDKNYLRYKDLYDKRKCYSPNQCKTIVRHQDLVNIYCIYDCKKNNYSDAYRCRNSNCPLYPIKLSTMKKPHILSEEFSNTNKERFLKVIQNGDN